MDTHVACLTPPGKAAIATVALRGSLAWSIAHRLFKPRAGALPHEPSTGRFFLGKLGPDLGDDVILAVKHDLPESEIEVHCHGGIEVVRCIVELCEAEGATQVPWPQFLGAEGRFLEMLAQAPTARTAAILWDQANGAWQQVEAKNDARTISRIKELIPLGQHLITPWQVALAGAPNVGKSSLMNALAGYTRTIVAATPGTTRDAVAVRFAIDGWPVELIDTAGIRAGAGELEGQGIDRARTAARDADLRLWVLDGAAEPTLPDDPGAWMYVINKIDQPAAWDWENVTGSCRTSAKTGAGLEELCQAVSHALVPAPPEPGEPVPCLPEQIAWVRAVCV
ncbi:MAG: 50S ribosome-binding GTPase [Planctomycetes bacterium]|nr:50S ribosome-binding GTPase [Planctomycetota bacterium]